jgi:hypothetical protein
MFQQYPLPRFVRAPQLLTRPMVRPQYVNALQPLQPLKYVDVARDAGAGRKKKKAAPAPAVKSKSKTSSTSKGSGGLSLKNTSLASLMGTAKIMLGNPHNYPLAIVLHWMFTHHAPLHHIDAVAIKFGKSSRQQAKSRTTSKPKAKSKAKARRAK